MTTDCWETPEWLFKELSEKYGPFDIDLCATRGNSKCEYYCIDYLNDLYKHLAIDRIHNFKGNTKTCFMNPPYSNPKPFIEKAWEDSKHCKIVCLVKCDPSTKWWATFWNYTTIWECEKCGFQYVGNYDQHCVCGAWSGYYIHLIENKGPKPGCEVHFLPKRVQFDPPKEMNAWKEGKSWYVKCYAPGCYGDGINGHTIEDGEVVEIECGHCKGTGKKKLSGPSFASAVVIMDRRNV